MSAKSFTSSYGRNTSGTRPSNGKHLFEAEPITSSDHQYRRKGYGNSNKKQNGHQDTHHKDENSANRNQNGHHGKFSNGIHKVNGVEYVSQRKSTEIIENSHPQKSLRHLLRQFDVGEKRQWPSYISDLTELFKKPQFSKESHKRNVIEDVTKVSS